MAGKLIAVHEFAARRPRMAAALGALEQVAVLEGLPPPLVEFSEAEGLTFTVPSQDATAAAAAQGVTASVNTPIRYADATIPERLRNFYSGLMQPALVPWLQLATVVAGAAAIWMWTRPVDTVAVQGLSGTRRKRRKSTRRRARR